jgi:CHAD domain-containing protein
MTIRRDPWPDHCRRELVGAMLEAAELFPHSGEDRAERIHQARRALKRARALVRLFAINADLAAYDVISALDAARRKIGSARDLDVMPDVLKSLEGEVDAATSQQLAGAIAFEREVAHIAHGDIDVTALATQLRAQARSVEAWSLGETTSGSLLKALRAGYRSARRLGRKAFAEGAAGDLHELRTLVVDLDHQFASFQPAWPALFIAMSAELRRLRQLLGEHNDLAMLGEFANSRRDISLARMSDLALKIERRQARLARRARASFGRLFTERPGALERRLASYLDNSKTRAKALESLSAVESKG